MPRGDRTGPMGFGPMTGRGAGNCAGYGVPGFMNRPFGGGFGRGTGIGRGMRGGGGFGWRNRYYATGLPGWERAGWWSGASPVSASPVVSKEQEADVLRAQAEYFEETLKSIKQRLDNLETKSQE